MPDLVPLPGSERTELAGAYVIPPFKRYEEVLDIV